MASITPAAGFVSPYGAFIIGLVGGIICYLGVLAKLKIGYDDLLDVFGVHGVGGFLEILATGIFAVFGVKGLIAGNASQLLSQFIANLSIIAYAGIGTIAIRI